MGIWRARQLRYEMGEYLRKVGNEFGASTRNSGCRLALVVTGADRDDTIVLDDPFA